MSTEAASLRERKKLRTRHTLVTVALDLFDARGFSDVTLDELCDTADVSKRTFFRYFTSKEDVVLAPSHKLWTGLVEGLPTRAITPGPLLDVLGAAVLDELDRPHGDTWGADLLRSLRLAFCTPSIEAHGLSFCERTTRSAAGLLGERAGLPDDDARIPLCLDVLVVAVNRAEREWAALPGEPGLGELGVAIRRQLAALPGAVTVTVGS